MGEDELYYLTMKSLFAFSLFFCSAESQMNDSDYDDRGWSVYEESIIRAEKSIALYKEIVNKALYCKFVQSKRSKFTFRFKKTAMDVTWHVKNGCNSERSRRDLGIESLGEDRYFYKVGPKGRIIFDYDEFENEGYGVIDEEIDQALFSSLSVTTRISPVSTISLGFNRGSCNRPNRLVRILRRRLSKWRKIRSERF